MCRLPCLRNTRAVGVDGDGVDEEWKQKKKEARKFCSRSLQVELSRGCAR